MACGMKKFACEACALVSVSHGQYYDSVAQLAARLFVKQRVVGSSPARIAFTDN